MTVIGTDQQFWPRLRAALAEVSDDAKRPPPEARAGAVLVLLAETGDGLEVVLTRRRRDLRSHPGQVSFPGGRIDPGESPEAAALREAREEIGLDPVSVDVVGAGPAFYIPPSRFWVVPVLSHWRAPHPLVENPWEVDAILRVPLAHLLDRRRWRHAPLSDRGSAWAWQLDDDLLWGATAGVISLMLDVALEGWSQGLRPEDLGADCEVRPWEHAPALPRRAVLEGGLPELDQAALPHVTAAQVRVVRDWLDARGVGPLARAEQAGRAATHAIRRLLAGDLHGAAVTVMAGPSTNGAAGLVAARLLHSAGADVDVLTVGAPRLPEQLQVLRDAEVEVRSMTPEGIPDGVSPGEVVLDAVLGIGTQPPLSDLPASAARWLQRHDVPVVALDLPSGLSADTGVLGPCIAADVTVATGLPTVGVGMRIAQAYVGDLYLADLGIPPTAWRAADVDPPEVFSKGPLVRLTIEAGAPDAGTPDQAELP